MIKQKYIVSIISIAIIVIYVALVYNTNQKYIPPVQKYYGLDESVECDGYKYVLKDMITYSIDELMDEYDFIPANIGMSQDGRDRLYYVACVEVTKIDKNAQYSEIGKYNKYSSGNTLEYFIESYINDGIIVNKDIELGETVIYYYVKSLLDYAFTDETRKNLNESDMWLRLYDDENDYEIFLGKDL